MITSLTQVSQVVKLAEIKRCFASRQKLTSNHDCKSGHHDGNHAHKFNEDVQ